MEIKEKFKDILDLPCVVVHDPALIFFRIPKNASTSIHRGYLRNNYPTINRKTSRHAYNKWQAEVSYEEFESYFKFCFVRNPWDRFVSLYIYFTRWRPEKGGRPLENRWEGNIPSFKEFTMNFEEICSTRKDIEQHAMNQAQFVFFNGKRFLDFVGKFEHLERDFIFVMNQLNLKDGNLPHYTKTKHHHYSYYYDDDTKEKVRELYEEDIKVFNYRFISV